MNSGKFDNVQHLQLSSNPDAIDPIDHKTGSFDSSKYEVAKIFNCPVWIDLGDNTLASIASATLANGLDSGIPLELSINMSVNCFIGPLIIFGFSIFLGTVLLSLFCFYSKKKTFSRERAPLARNLLTCGKNENKFNENDQPKINKVFQPEAHYQNKASVFIDDLHFKNKNFQRNFAFEQEPEILKISESNQKLSRQKSDPVTKPYSNPDKLSQKIIATAAKNTLHTHRQVFFDHIQPDNLVVSSNKDKSRVIYPYKSNKINIGRNGTYR